MASDPLGKKQQTLKLDRRQQLLALRRLHVGNTHAKFLLTRLDDHIGNHKEWFCISVDDLANECELSLSTAKKWLRWLDHEGYIEWDAKQGRRPRFRICWKVIFDAVDGSDEDPNVAQESRVVAFEKPSDGLESRVAAFDRLPDGPESRETAFPNKEEAPLSAPESAIEAPPPSSPTATGSDRMMVVKRLQAVGVGQAGPAVKTALRQGMTLAQVAKVIDYHAEYPGRWSPGVLYERLTRICANQLAADEGWYGDEVWQAKQARKAVNAIQQRSQPTNSAPWTGLTVDVLESNQKTFDWSRGACGALGLPDRKESHRMVLAAAMTARHKPNPIATFNMLVSGGATDGDWSGVTSRFIDLADHWLETGSEQSTGMALAGVGG